jgi:hypothetical protein
MKKLFLITIPLMMTLLLGCKKPSDSNPTPTEANEITIVSVAPSTGLTDGKLTNFIVTVNYKLVTKDQGELNVGFNNSSSETYYQLVSSATKIIAKGSGTYTFNVNVTTKKWANAPFQVYVNLSENPHGSPWSPLANATQNLAFQ